MVALLGLAMLGVVVWRAWPIVAEQWQARKSKSIVPKSNQGDARKPKTSSSATDTIARLKKENQSLREDNQRLRDQLERTTGAMEQKNSEIDELKLRILILEKTRVKEP
ncbi:hypothetical protein AMJ85_10240 [candidate division BRC1 bacterium SM23_51]|nr:MAG: hypothetical protein AMJ85_10240 [candidate division BRC1 bacterium SM23_51]